MKYYSFLLEDTSPSGSPSTPPKPTPSPSSTPKPPSTPKPNTNGLGVTKQQYQNSAFNAAYNKNKKSSAGILGGVFGGALGAAGGAVTGTLAAAKNVVFHPVKTLQNPLEKTVGTIGKHMAVGSLGGGLGGGLALNNANKKFATKQANQAFAKAGNRYDYLANKRASMTKPSGT